MITGPALCLYFAALRCTTNPPSVSLPRSKSKSSSTPMHLSYENCPPPFVSFLRVWANTVPTIQSLVPEAQHDLARVICGLQPLHVLQDSENKVVINGIAGDLRAVAIEISQRRSFQDRYASDLQAALDAGSGGPSSKKTSFVPPPVYDSSPSLRRPTPVPQPSPGLLSSSVPYSATSSSPSRRQSPSSRTPSPGLLSSSIPYSATSSRRQSPSSRTPSPSLFPQDSPAIEFIRETLYASLADVLESKPSLRQLLKRDPPRAYFASVAFAILDVSINSMNPDNSVIGILGKRLTVSECPHELRPFMIELAIIGEQAKSMDEEDNQYAMKLAQQGRSDQIPLSRLDRVRLMWEKGVGYENGNHDDDGGGEGRRSVEGRAVAFANKVNALGLALTKLKAFRERQEYVFTVLGGIGS